MEIQGNVREKTHKLKATSPHLGIVTTDVKGIVLSVNHNIRRMFGYKKNELIKRNVDTLFAGSYAEEHVAYISRFLKTGDPIMLGKVHAAEGKTKSGQFIYVNLDVSVTTVNKEMVFIILFSKIREHKVVFKLNETGIILSTSKTVRTVTGYTQEELIETNFSNLLINTPELDKFDICVKNMANGNSKTVDIITKKKTIIQVTLDIKSILDEPLHYKVILQPLIDTLEAVITMNTKGFIISCNKGCTVLFGYKKEALVGENIRMLIPSPLDDLPYLKFSPKTDLSDDSFLVSVRHNDGTMFYAMMTTERIIKKESTLLRCIITRCSSSNKFASDDLHPGDILGVYKIMENIGQGYFGVVKRARHRYTGHDLAIKTLRRRQYAEIAMQYPPREVYIWSQLNHPNIATLYDIIYGIDRLYLVSEYAPCGNFLSLLNEKKRLSESEARMYMTQLLSAVDYMHYCGIVHRDLKPDNILVFRDRILKIADFGLSNCFDGKHLLTTFCGTIGFVAPELWLGEYYTGWPVDIWALGVILYITVTGHKPFCDAKTSLKGKLEWPKQHPKCSKAVRHLVERMLVFDPKKRATLKEVMSHHWITKDGRIDQVPRYSSNTGEHTLIDDEILKQAKKYGLHRHDITKSVKAGEHNQFSTVYYLLLKDKQKKSEKQLQKCNSGKPFYIVPI